MSWLIISRSSQLIVHFDMKPESWWESWTYFSSCLRPLWSWSEQLAWNSLNLHQRPRRVKSDTGSDRGTVFLAWGTGSPLSTGRNELWWGTLHYLWEMHLSTLHNTGELSYTRKLSMVSRVIRTLKDKTARWVFRVRRSQVYQFPIVATPKFSGVEQNKSVSL